MKSFLVNFSLASLLFVIPIEVVAHLRAEPSEQSRDARFLIYDPALGWTNRPGMEGKFESRRAGYQAHVSFDARGIRSNGSESQAGPKILVIGDSTTAGMEVDNEKTYCAVLEGLLRQGGRAVNVINGGVRGYGADQSYLRLVKLIPQIKPDTVIFMASEYGWSQMTTIKNWYRPLSKPTLALTPHGLELLNSPAATMDEETLSFVDYEKGDYRVVNRRVKLLGLARWLRQNSFLYAWLDEIYYTWVNNAAVAPPKRNPEIERRLLGQIIAKMRDISPRFLMTGFFKPKDTPHYETFRAIAKEEGISFLDIKPSFRGDRVYDFPNDGHWNEEGHRRAAQALKGSIDNWYQKVAGPIGGPGAPEALKLE